MGTHINAFHADVEEAKQAVVQAESRLQQAEAALRAHPDYVEPVEEEVEPPSSPAKVNKTKAEKAEEAAEKK